MKWFRPNFKWLFIENNNRNHSILSALEDASIFADSDISFVNFGFGKYSNESNFSTSYDVLDVYNNGYLNGGKLRTKKRYVYLVDDEMNENYLVNIEKSSKFATRKDYSDITLSIGLVVINLEGRKKSIYDSQIFVFFFFVFSYQVTENMKIQMK